jgi:hypothetical protein
VNRRLEDDGCDGHRHAQEGGDNERTKIRLVGLVHSKILWAGWRPVPRGFGNPRKLLLMIASAAATPPVHVGAGSSGRS